MDQFTLYKPRSLKFNSNEMIIKYTSKNFFYQMQENKIVFCKMIAYEKLSEITKKKSFKFVEIW